LRPAGRAGRIEEAWPVHVTGIAERSEDVAQECEILLALGKIRPIIEGAQTSFDLREQDLQVDGAAECGGRGEDLGIGQRDIQRGQTAHPDAHDEVLGPLVVSSMISFGHGDSSSLKSPVVQEKSDNAASARVARSLVVEFTVPFRPEKARHHSRLKNGVSTRMRRVLDRLGSGAPVSSPAATAASEDSRWFSFETDEGRGVSYPEKRLFHALKYQVSGGSDAEVWTATPRRLVPFVVGARSGRLRECPPAGTRTAAPGGGDYSVKNIEGVWWFVDPHGENSSPSASITSNRFFSAPRATGRYSRRVTGRGCSTPRADPT